MSIDINLYKNDLPEDLELGNSVAIDCEFMVDQTDMNNLYNCTLNCDENFNAEFFGRFKVSDIDTATEDEISLYE